MAQTYYDGTRASGADLGVNSDQKKIEMADKIYRLEPNNNPLLRLSTKLNKRVSGQVTYNHMEASRHDRYSRVNNGSGITSAATTIAVDTGSAFRAGYIIRGVVSGEIMRVTSVSTNDLTVVRSWGATAAASLADNAYLLIVGDSNTQGALAPTAKSVSPTTKTNYTQIFRFPWAITNTAKNIQYYAEDEQARLGRDAGLEHAEQIERAHWLGEKKLDVATVSSDHPTYTTGGFHEWVTTNVSTETALTQQEWHDWMRTVFQYGSSEKWVFCSGLIVSALDWWGIGKLQTSINDKMYGITVLKWQSSHGMCNIVHHKGFDRWGYDGTITGAMACAVDPDNVGYRYIANRDTHIVQNIQANDADQTEHEYLTECGFEVQNESTHAILKGVTSYS